MARLAMPSRGDRCLRPGGARRGFTERRDRPTLATARAADAHRRRRQAGVAERRLRERGADRRAQDGAAHRAPPLRRAAVARSLHLRSCADVLRRCARGAAATLPLRARVHRILQPALLPWAAAAMPPAASLAPPRPAPAGRVGARQPLVKDQDQRGGGARAGVLPGPGALGARRAQAARRDRGCHLTRRTGAGAAAAFSTPRRALRRAARAPPRGGGRCSGLPG
mmetsp:Transcript_953/g.2551  ORF Transcript_953/g.2551 Transcript_953/m.2551 type:complete len:225 (-) Transcript_953:1045-1719(-)